MPKKKKETQEQCCHINRVPVHSSIRIGGASLGQCENPCLPGMTVCYKHADREAMAMWIRELASRVISLGGKV